MSVDDPTLRLVSDSGFPIFLGGQRRSGTTLMRTILNRHPHIACMPECHFFQEEGFELFFRHLLERRNELFERMRIGTAEMDRAVAAFLDSMFTSQRLHCRAGRWAEKSPENILRIDYLFRLFPEAQFIHLIRDPRDTLCSMKQQAATYKPNWVKFTAEVTAPEWVRCIQAGVPWRDRPDRYLEVRYEDLARQPEDTVRRVLDFLGEPGCSSVLDTTGDRVRATKGGNDHKPIFTNSIGRWTRDLSGQEVACIEAIAGETMSALGYPLAAVPEAV
jgi:hypothetical protein